MKSKKLRDILSLFFFVLVAISAFGQNTPERIHQDIQKQTAQIFDSLINIRRDLHRYPEISGEEKRTSEKIAEYLIGLGLEVKTNIGGYGVVGILKGVKPGKKNSLACRY